MKTDIVKQWLRKSRVLGRYYLSIVHLYALMQLRKKKKAYLWYGEESFCRVVCTLNDAGIRYFPAFGTLLGLIRDGQLIPHDLDLDFGVIVEGNEYDWNRLRSALTETGFSLLHWYESEGIILEMTFVPPMSTKVHIDFFAFFRRNDQLVAHTCWRVKNREYNEKQDYSLFEETFPTFEQLIPAEYLGVTVPIPENAEALLEASYTSSWRIPNAGWKEEDKPNKKEVEGILARIQYERKDMR